MMCDDEEALSVIFSEVVLVSSFKLRALMFRATGGREHGHPF